MLKRAHIKCVCGVDEVFLVDANAELITCPECEKRMMRTISWDFEPDKKGEKCEE
jgi:hypothetical protein